MSDSKILLVDDDPRLLDSLHRAYRRKYDLSTALMAAEGLRVLNEQGPFAVVVSDFKMPEMNGVEFLRRVRQEHPQTVRVMLTGQADLTTAIGAVNEGCIFRFLTKPCDEKTLTGGLDSALEQYQLRQAEAQLTERTLRGSIAVLADVLSLSHPAAFGRSLRIRNIVRRMVHQLDLEAAWKFETAALLSQVGCVAVPTEILDRAAAGAELAPAEREALDRHTDVAAQLLDRIPRLEGVARMIAGSRDPGALPAEETEEVRLGAEMLAAAVELDRLMARGITLVDALRAIRARRRFRPSVVEALNSAPGQLGEGTSAHVPITLLRPGAVLDQDVLSTEGKKLLACGQEITPGVIARLQTYHSLGRIANTVAVRFPADAAEDAA